MTIDKLIQPERNRLHELKARLMQQLVEFETQYELSSTQFYAQYMQGTIGDEMDFIEWAATIQMLNNLDHRSTQYFRHS